MLETSDGWREIRFHDYADIYSVPGLYEQLFYDTLECDSPRFVCDFLRAELVGAGVDPSQLRVFDLGAGNGIMGEELTKLGVEFVVGADILPAAAMAAERDRPGIYHDYLVADLTALTDDQHGGLVDCGFNAMTCIAALGFGDIPTECFRTAFNLLADGGWVGMNIKQDFMDVADTSGFGTLLREAVAAGALEVVGSTVYQHRVATSGEPLNYTALVGRKHAQL